MDLKERANHFILYSFGRYKNMSNAENPFAQFAFDDAHTKPKTVAETHDTPALTSASNECDRLPRTDGRLLLDYVFVPPPPRTEPS